MSQTAPTYAERASWKHGTITERLSKDAVPNFCDCHLTLCKARDPVVTPGGILYSREAILESLLSQKRANKEKQAAYERHLAKMELKKARGQEHETSVEALAMAAKQMGASDTAVGRIIDESRREYEREESGKQVLASVKTIKSEAKKMESLKSYWISGHERSDGKAGPEQIPEKPDSTTRCPATGKPLRLKDLVTVRFDTNKAGEYVDPVTLKELSNATQLVVLKDVKEGPNVVSRKTYERVIKPEGQYNGTPIEDVIELAAGATGFAATNELEASAYMAMGSKLQRGQAAARTGASSGLRFGN